jgi:hypothetical protein
MAWKFFTSTGQEKQILAGSSVGAYALLQDQKTSGTNGGTATSGSWQTRTLNTEVVDANGIVSLSANQFTLEAGTYRIRAQAPAYIVSTHQVRIQNVTDATTPLLGTSEYDAAVSVQTTSVAVGEFTITGTKTFELQHRVGTTGASNGFGVATSFGTEVYGQVEIWKVA